MANRYSCGARTVASGATSGNAGFGIWNPHANKSIAVREIYFFTTAATAMQFGISRASAKGTTTDVTPDADNAFDRLAAPPSGCVIVTDFSAEPTLQGPDMVVGSTAAVIGAGFTIGFPEPIMIPAGTGLYVVTRQAVALPACDLTIVWDE